MQNWCAGSTHFLWINNFMANGIRELPDAACSKWMCCLGEILSVPPVL